MAWVLRRIKLYPERLRASRSLAASQLDSARSEVHKACDVEFPKSTRLIAARDVAPHLTKRLTAEWRERGLRKLLPFLARARPLCERSLATTRKTECCDDPPGARARFETPQEPLGAWSGARSGERRRGNPAWGGDMAAVWRRAKTHAAK